MINNYEIRKEKQEEVLYIYLDFDDEFAKLGFKQKAQKLQTTIRNFIKANKIDFKGAKVALVVGGVMMGTMLLNNPSLSVSAPSNLENNTTIEEIVDQSTVANPIVENPVEDLFTDVKTDIVEDLFTDVKLDTQNSNTENESTQGNLSNEISKPSQSVSENKASTISNPIKVEQPVKKEVVTHPVETNTPVPVAQPKPVETVEATSPIVQEPVVETPVVKEPVVEEPIQNQIYVTVHRSNGTVVTLELEEYIIGVVGAEMPASFHDQALMSQAIIARTYALKAMERGVTLTDTSSTQNYKSNDQLRNTWGNDYNYYYNKIKNAVDSTKGIYLTYRGSLIDAVYHSTSNGVTEDAKNVWGNAFPYLVSVDSSYDSTNQSFQAEKFITYEELSNKLQSPITSETNFTILGYTEGNRISNIEINGTIYTGVKIRSLLGLRSASFSIQKSDTGVTFVTTGYGHGVGLSQYGANGMAKAGYSYRQILQHYYQGVAISHL